MEQHMRREDPRLVELLQRGFDRRARRWRLWLWSDKYLLRLSGQPRLRLPRMRVLVPLLCVVGFVIGFFVVAANTPDPPLNPCGAGAPSTTVYVGPQGVSLGGEVVTANRFPAATSQPQQSVTLVVPHAGQYRITQINYNLGAPYVENTLVKGTSVTLLTENYTAPGVGYQVGSAITSLNVCRERLKPKGVGKR